MQECGREYGGDREFQVFPGQRGQRVLVADYLALLGHLDRAVERAVRLGQDRLVRRATAPADGATPSVEQPQPYAVLGGRVAQRPLRLVDRPL